MRGSGCGGRESVERPSVGGRARRRVDARRCLPTIGPMTSAPAGDAAGPERSGPHPPAVAFGHRPALDGVRGFAVVMVVLFHGGFSITRGGYLGVSVFFTLSGFLITSLALVEFENTRRLAIGSFWLRRVRRLVPALLVALGLAVVAVAIVGHDASRRSLLADVVGGLTYTENWRWILADRSYGDLFTAPSPLLHLWSLSVEEQFYIVFPLLAAVVLRWGRRALGAVAVLVIAAGVALPPVFDWSIDRAYYGTDVRAAEIAVGVVAAVLLFGRSSIGGRLGRRILATASTLALVIVLVACIAVPQSWDGWRRGGFVAFALASVLVVIAAASDVGPVAVAGRTRVLRRLGRVSYGLYLYHWVVLWFLGAATDWSATLRFVVGLAISYALAEVSLRLLEDPVRTGRWPWPRRRIGFSAAPVSRRRAVPLLLVAVAVIAVVAGSVAVGSRATPAIDFEAAQDRLVSGFDAPVPAAVGDARPTVAIFGDSTATMTAVGLAHALATSPWSESIVQVEGDTRLGCGTLLSDMNRGADGRVLPLGESCRTMVADWRDAVDARRPDIAVLGTGRWETWDMRVPGADGWRGLGDPVFDSWAEDQLRIVVDALGSAGATVVLLTPPSESRAELLGPIATDARLERWSEILREVAAERPDRVVVVDLARWHVMQGERDARLRRDGIHVDEESGAIVADEFLLPALVTVAAARR